MGDNDRESDEKPPAPEHRQSIFSKRWFRAVAASALVAGFAAGGFGIAQATTTPKSTAAADAASRAPAWGERAGHLSGRHLFPVVAGTVEAVGSNSFTLKGLDGKTVTVDVSSATRYKERGIAAASFADLKKGETVVVVGTLSSGRITAKAVLLDLGRFGRFGGGPFGPAKRWRLAHLPPPFAAGTVESVAAKRFTLDLFAGRTVTVEVTAATTYRERAVRSATFTNVKKGETVAVVGTLAAGTITAKAVFIDLGPFGPFGRFGGHGGHGGHGGFRGGPFGPAMPSQRGHGHQSPPAAASTV